MVTRGEFYVLRLFAVPENQALVDVVFGGTVVTSRRPPTPGAAHYRFCFRPVNVRSPSKLNHDLLVALWLGDVQQHVSCDGTARKKRLVGSLLEERDAQVWHCLQLRGGCRGGLQYVT